MKKFIKLTAVFAVSTVMSATAAFADPFVAIGPKIGTQGIGIEGRAPVMENTYVRLGANYFTFKKDYTDKNFGSDLVDDLGYGNNPIVTAMGAAGADIDLKFKGNLTLTTVPLMVDYHPFDNSGFRVSAGIAYNGNKVKITSSPIVTLNGVAIDGNLAIPGVGTVNLYDYLGSISGTIKSKNPVAGVLTLGYDNSFISQNAFSFSAEAGIMYVGKPKVSLSGNGTILGEKEVVAYLEKKVKKKFKSIERYLEWYPILSVGVKYSF